MRISDWSSDVCSSDLEQFAVGGDRPGRVADRIGILGEELHRGLGLRMAVAEHLPGHRQHRVQHGQRFLRATGLRQGSDAVDQDVDRVRMARPQQALARLDRSEEHTSELQSLMRISYAVFCLKKKKTNTQLTN